MDIATMFNKYAFLGHEFLTWLWYASENTPEMLNVLKNKKTELTVGNKVVIVNGTLQAGRSAKVTIQGEESDLKEAMVAVKDGGWVSDIYLRLNVDQVKYEFTLDAQELKISGFKCSERVTIEKDDDIDGAIMERMHLISGALEFIDLAFEQFIKFRINDKWNSQILPDLSGWVCGTESTAAGIPLNKRVFS